MFLPRHNARLTQVSGGGQSEDYDTPAGSPTPKWTGSADAAVVEHIVAQAGPNGLDQARQTYLAIPGNLANYVALGDTVTFTRDGQTLSRKVDQIQDHREVGTVRLYFWDVPA